VGTLCTSLNFFSKQFFHFFVFSTKNIEKSFGRNTFFNINLSNFANFFEKEIAKYLLSSKLEKTLVHIYWPEANLLLQTDINKQINLLVSDTKKLCNVHFITNNNQFELHCQCLQLI